MGSGRCGSGPVNSGPVQSGPVQSGPVHLRPAYPVLTSRLVLRPLVAGDVDALLAYRGLPEVCRYLPFPPMTREVLEARIAGDLGRTTLDEPGQALTLGAWSRDDGQLLGDVVLLFRDLEHRGGELGYVFSPAAAGQGYGWEACAAVLALAFDELGLHRVVARIDSRNDRSVRLATRLGMRQEGHHVRSALVRGSWVDELVLALLEDEWPDSPAARRRRA